MTKSQFDLIRTNEWMRDDSCDFMNFKESTPNYLVIERIVTNVAASFGIDYRSMLHANESSPMYVPLCISFLLIDRIFKNIFNLNEDERISLIGIQCRRIIEDYRRYRSF